MHILVFWKTFQVHMILGKVKSVVFWWCVVKHTCINEMVNEREKNNKKWDFNYEARWFEDKKISDRYWLITGEIRALTTDVVAWLAQRAVRTVGGHAGGEKRNNSA